MIKNKQAKTKTVKLCIIQGMTQFAADDSNWFGATDTIYACGDTVGGSQKLYVYACLGEKKREEGMLTRTNLCHICTLQSNKQALTKPLGTVEANCVVSLTSNKVTCSEWLTFGNNGAIHYDYVRMAGQTTILYQTILGGSGKFPRKPSEYKTITQSNTNVSIPAKKS